MLKLFRTFYLMTLFIVGFSISINGQTEEKQTFEPTFIDENKAKVIKKTIVLENKISKEIVKPKKAIDHKEAVESKDIVKPIEFALSKEFIVPKDIIEPKDTLIKGNEVTPKQKQAYVFPSKKVRFNRYLNRTVGTGLIGVGVASVFQQIDETPPEWENNSTGFLRRFGSNLGIQAISESVSYGLEESLKLDSKFYKSKKKDFGSRVKNAFLSTFTARNRSGKRVFNPSRIVGRYTGNVIATETWYPNRFNYKDGLRQGTQQIGFSIGFNFLQEFIFPD